MAKVAPSAGAVVRHLVTSKRQQDVATREIERGIRQLASLGVTQRDIAALAGLSQPEVSRRLKRQQLTVDVDRLRSIVAEREAARLSSDEMIRALASAMTARRKPGRISAYDGASTSSPSSAELMNLFRSKAISRDEYEAVRALLRERKSR
ncbi:hypothetical protein LH407_05855 [Antiquaquibacter oligotrophicus]|uniref:hypothetical protein n=1 Tax=Antiquaquibacter oligotrophicus TaxID=2880260 RepID=UPI002AC9A2A2|nr:hypothetical protein [Antiquaquibacter oligotrophicus]UDF14386.1 hypothetical protein LH407_05855 [Antiquaquibacter oligotrophicus]